MSLMDEFASRFDEAQQRSPFYEGPSAIQQYPPPRKFNPRVIVARIVLSTESADVAEAVCEDLIEVVRGSCGDHYSQAGWAITTLAALE